MRPRLNPLPGFRYRLSSASDLCSVDDYRRAARRRLPAMVWAFVEGAAEDHVTADANRAAFGRWALDTHVLTGHDAQDLEVEVAGRTLSLPVLLAPTGLAGIAHWSGELGAARAAERAGTRAIVSSAATYSVEEIADGTHADHFFQLYPWADPAADARALTRSFIARAQRSGYRALVVTADVPVLGNREAERRLGMGMPPVLTPRRVLDGLRHPRWARGFVRHQRFTLKMFDGESSGAAAVRSVERQMRFMRPEVDWDDFAWTREQWQGPMYLKGVMHPDDAQRAVELGADGVVVSNHGGRQLDGALATLDVLPAVVDRIGGRAEILVDGGIRRGADVVKALCLGATAVCIGRPYLYGLAVGGQNGVAHVLEILREEISRALTLMGVADVRSLGRSWLHPAGHPLEAGERLILPGQRNDH
ncbi:alpha-hydroxy acid oxidase [Capillimicrobium parvum]|uniref:(S)-mandelate dehydrogenase n=1 Tax=Capillimicrobium parvum TaxID=2884022 RepID=A0A9E6XST5_9ACTN|nr:alpha-hydroxy acid oxidase [Capillimicrobium parvum]UGS33670.1 (S)-mandelate dehydrogenase [Capillimicrobium parvum]